jgi:transposase
LLIHSSSTVQGLCTTMSKRLLPFVPHFLAVKQVVADADRITITCRARFPAARCPNCRLVSMRTHSHYQRRIADLPWQGRPVTLCFEVRRLRCGNRRCIRRIFAERAEEIVGMHGRRTVRLRDIQRSVGLALGGEAGTRLIERLGMPISADTLLRIVRNTPSASRPAPRILGVDDWAWRRGQRYGTMLIDLQTSRVVDLLPDREGATLACWLRAHPGVEVVARDRAGAYAQGARQGAPDARQIADRWHMLRNCSDALLDAVEKRYRLVREVGQTLAGSKEAGAVEQLDCRRATPGMSKAAQDHQRQSRARRLALFNAMADLQQKGWSISAIARETGLDRKTIRQRLIEQRPGTWQRPSRHPADAFKDFLHQRWEEGCRNASRLYREVGELGYNGDARGFRRWVKMRLREAVPVTSSAPAAFPRWKPPSPRQTVRLLTTPIDILPSGEGAFVAALRAASPAIAMAADLARRFHTMLTGRDADALDPWLDEALNSAIASFARGLKRDVDAVRAALTLPWSTGPVEGKINKLKLIKRSMYGRAGLDLLRARIMA